MFGLSPMQSAGIIIANSVAGKMYLTSWRLADPEGAPGEWGGGLVRAGLTAPGPCAGNRKFENAHKAQLNEAEWSPLLFGGLALLAVKGVDAELCAELCAFGSVWYLWSRSVGGGINGEPLVLPGGLTRYFGGMLLAYEVVALGFG